VSLDVLVKLGALASAVGVVLMVLLAIVLLAFPVTKECDQHAECLYRSTAPAQLEPVVRPGFLAISLLSISGGIFLLRFGRWREGKQTEANT
jgi:hypothetical protein